MISKQFLTSKNNNLPIIIAHRGFSEIAPENTIASFKKAIEEKVDMIEFDVRLSSDDIFIVIHDKNLLRTANVNENINKLSSDILKQLDCGSWFNKKYSTEKIPLLSDVLKLASKKTYLNIEIKPDIKSKNGFVPELLMNEIRNSKSINYLLITSFNHKFVSEVKKIDTNITTGVLYNSFTDFRFSPTKLVKRSNANIFLCNKLQINKDVVSDAHKSEIPVFVYGIKTEADVRRLIELKIDGIIADDPKMVRETLSKYF